MKKASIDIGSNSVLLFIAEVAENEIISLRDEARVTGLGKEVDKNKRFNDLAMDSTFKALEEYCEIIKAYNISFENVLVTATEASRVVSNSFEFFNKIKNKLNLDVKIISGTSEAYYSTLGVISNINENQEGRNKKSLVKNVLIDVGGASTEFILFEPDPFKIIKTISLPMGSVRATDWHIAGHLSEKVEQLLNTSALSEYKGSFFYIGVAGTITSLAGMIQGFKYFDAAKVQGYEVERASLALLLEEMQNLSSQEILKQWSFLGKRSDSIYGGAYLVLEVMKRLDLKKLEVSTFGLRQGLLVEGKIYEDIQF